MGRIINTSNGPVEIPDDNPHVINTSRVVEEDLIHEDAEPEVIGTAAGDGWHCVYEVRDELRAIPVLCWAQLDNDVVYPVVAPRDGGQIDLTVDASEDPRFKGLVRPPADVDVVWATRADIVNLLDRQTIELEEEK